MGRMEVTPELLIDIGKQLAESIALKDRVTQLEAEVKELQIELKALQKSTHEVQFIPATEQELPEDEYITDYQEDPRAKEVVKKLFGTEDMEDARE